MTKKEIIDEVKSLVEYAKLCPELTRENSILEILLNSIDEVFVPNSLPCKYNFMHFAEIIDCQIGEENESKILESFTKQQFALILKYHPIVNRNFSILTTLSMIQTVGKLSFFNLANFFGVEALNEESMEKLANKILEKEMTDEGRFQKNVSILESFYGKKFV